MQVILWDIDGTLLNFKAAEKAALRACFRSLSVPIEGTDEEIARYSEINRTWWERMEKGEVTKPEVLRGRFCEFFAKEGIFFDRIEELNDEYQIRLGDTTVFFDRADELVASLRGRVKQYAATNGTAVAQERKLKNSGLDQLLDGVFISEKVGAEKPNKVFFEAAFREIGTVAPGEAMIVGDSLTGDIRGGKNAGILTCWYNPQGEENRYGIVPDFEIRNLWDVLNLPPMKENVR